MTPRLLLLATAAASALFLSAQSQSFLSNDIIDTYSEMIAQRPDDSGLYLSRATEYLSQGLVSLALPDLNDALRLADKNDKELRFEILYQRSSVFEKQRDYEGALADILAASNLMPDVPDLILSKARIYTGLGKYPEARENYNRYRRLNPRSTEALFGLARVCALEGDSDKALAYMKEGVDVAPRAGQSYLSAAEIHTLLGRNDEAVADFIRAIACGDESASSALQSLVDRSNEDYPLVMAGLDRAISDSPTSGELYYMRATIAQDHDHHRHALADFQRIDGIGPFAGGALGESIAESLFALMETDEALNQLERVPPTLRGSSWHTLRSRILLFKGKAEEAVNEAVAALIVDPENIAASEAKARSLIAAGRKDDARAEIAGSIIDNPAGNPTLYFLGASLADGQRRESLIEEASLLPFDPADPSSLRGFALLAEGLEDQAFVWAASIDRFDTVRDGRAQFIAACLYSQAGKTEEAKKMLEKAEAAGFDNRYLIDKDSTPMISLVR